MALKALMLKRKIDLKKKTLEELREKLAGFVTREAELETAIGEVETEEQRTAVEEEITAFEQERDETQESADQLESEISQLETELQETEAAQETEPAPEDSQNPADENAGDQHGAERQEERGGVITMNRAARRAFGRMTTQERDTFFAREDVKNYLNQIRECMKNKRAVDNVGLTIPTVMLGVLKEKITYYSKLLKHVTVRAISGNGRQIIMGTVPEAVWTECCADLNELSLGFNDMELDCYKVGGFFAVCNANLEDSDVDLAGEVIDALGQAIGKALDKAILYGRNTSGANKMPMGIVTRLAQTAKPDNYPATARTWTDLHSSNIKTITAANSTGTKLIQQLVILSAEIKSDYASDGMTWVMNEKTRAAILASTVATDANGQIVAGMNANTMPVLGGAIETLTWIPDNVIICGYFELYLLTERAGTKFATSEHVRFLQDQTVFKGTARYDGAPAIAEAFMAIGINAAAVRADDVTFAGVESGTAGE